MADTNGPAVLIPEYKAQYGMAPNYIDGTFTPSQSARTMPITNPATGGEIGTVALSTHGEVDMAVQAAPVSYTHLRAHETDSYLVCRLLLEKKKKKTKSH